VLYEFEYVSDPGKSSEASMYPTEVFVPRVPFPLGYDGHFSVTADDKGTTNRSLFVQS